IWTMQVQQSRAGVNITQDDVFGNLEFDFINFAQSSPTTESRPRLRRALVGYSVNESNKIQIGQDWDTFSPSKPNTLDYVGLFFNAGNTGFMRQQIKWTYAQDSLKSELSIGMPGKNPSPEYNQIETTSIPVIAYAI